MNRPKLLHELIRDLKVKEPEHEIPTADILAGRLIFNKELCYGCAACAENCPEEALTAEDAENTRTLFYNLSKCAFCGKCIRNCPRDAISKENVFDLPEFLGQETMEINNFNLIRCECCNAVLGTDEQLREVAEEMREIDEFHEYEIENLCDKCKQKRLGNKLFLFDGK
ncbi:MAG: hypothetical protein A7316_07060 [Candidatus Altiarchaeales archaeon WOR_SM1_86-2]|nr:MAG: hypothetical protein A7315_05470 [Candidatus Altiarchaeales archaeon WOR_SM1_79]ODS38796.1 MAG: hypothetical protein A7316_07060 [Candidatus Altiarchaeales archaeon WOR_SM1_86-2]